MKSVRIFLSTLVAVLMTAAYAVAGGVHTGTVLETQTAGGYTYMNIDENGNKFWIAGPQNSVKKGAKVSFSEQVWMQNFQSKALNRTFDKILFVSGVDAAGAKAPAAKQQPQQPQAIKLPKVAPAQKAKNKVADKLTVEQVYSRGAALKGRLIKVTGKVVKVSENIMGRTWVHVTDGTGSQGTNKLVFTTNATKPPAVGDAVTAQGVVDTDKDFGFGYFYSIIVENSTFAANAAK